VAQRTTHTGSIAATHKEGAASARPLGARRLVSVLDLVDDDRLIAEYRRRHAPGAVWPEVIEHLRDRGVLDMEIWTAANRLVMVMTVTENFPRDVPEPPRIAVWERMMDAFQLRLPGTPLGVKWLGMTRIFTLDWAGEPS
jgi:L-rhamnose mutarotase